MQARKFFIVVLCISILIVRSAGPARADGITFADVHKCAVVVGDFADVIPVVQFGGTVLKATGILPDEEKEFRKRLEAQNKQILDGIFSLKSGMQRIEVSLEEIQTELKAIKGDIGDIQKRNRGSDLYIEVYPFLKRVSRVDDPDANAVSRLRDDLQELMDQAEAASTLSSAELSYYSGVSLICVSVGRCYHLDVIQSGGKGLNEEQLVFYRRAAESSGRLLSHCETTFDLLAKRHELRQEYSRSVEALKASTKDKGFAWRDESNKLTLEPFGLRRTVKPVETNRIVLFRTEKKPGTVVTERRFSLSASPTELQKSPLDEKEEAVLVFRHLDVSDFTELSQGDIGESVSMKEINPSDEISTHLAEAVKDYNQRAEVCCNLAFQVTLADGLTKWLQENRKLLSDLDSVVAKK